MSDGYKDMRGAFEREKEKTSKLRNKRIRETTGEKKSLSSILKDIKVKYGLGISKKDKNKPNKD